MQIDKQFAIDELKKQGQSDRIQEALAGLPANVDYEQHAAMLEKYGIDAGELAEKAAREGVARL